MLCNKNFSKNPELHLRTAFHPTIKIRNKIRSAKVSVMREILIVISVLFLVVFASTSCNAPDTARRADELNKYGIKCIKVGLWREAELRFQQALELDSQMAIYHNNLGVALEAQGRTDEALAEYESALKLDPTNQEIYENLTRFKNVNNIQ